MSLYYRDHLIASTGFYEFSNLSNEIDEIKTTYVKTVDSQQPDPTTRNIVVTLEQIALQNQGTGCYANLPANQKLEIRRGITDADAAVVLNSNSGDAAAQIQSGTVNGKKSVLKVKSNGDAVVSEINGNTSTDYNILRMNNSLARNPVQTESLTFKCADGQTYTYQLIRLS